MTNGAVALLRKPWASLMAWMAAMGYSAADYTTSGSVRWNARWSN